MSIVTILNNLTGKPKKTENLKETISSVDENELEEYLEFSAKITAHGYLEKNSNGWKLVSYDNKPNLETPAK